MDLRAHQNGVTLDFSWPGKPTANAFIKAFNGGLRTECLSTHWLLSLADAAEKIGGLASGHYNEHRPHGDWIPRPGRAHKIGTRKPVLLIKGGNSDLS